MSRQGKIPGRPQCPKCRRVLDGFTGVNNDARIEPGDYCVCAYCGAPLRWDGFAYHVLTGSALVLARLNHSFVQGEAVARKFREQFGGKRD